jgi:hypothetical protein
MDATAKPQFRPKHSDLDVSRWQQLRGGHPAFTEGPDSR